MSTEIPNLDNAMNFTKTSGIVFQLGDGVPPVGRPMSKVLVFDKLGRNLKYFLNDGQTLGLAKHVLDKVNKAQYLVVSVTTLSKFFRFKTDFNFGDLKVSDVMVETRLKTAKPDEIAVGYAEDGDPVKDICYMIKAHLSKVFTEIRLEDLDNLQEFTDGVSKRVREMKISHPYLELEEVSVQYKLPKEIEEAFEEIQKHRFEQKKAKERADREYKELEQSQRLEQLRNEFDLKVKELQLERLGITDIRIRLLMTDPERRAQYLDEIYKFQMDQLKERREQATELLKMKREIIRKHFDAISTDVTDAKQVEKILKLLDESGAAYPGESLLGTVVTVKEDILPKSPEPELPSSTKPPITKENLKSESKEAKTESK